MIIRWDGARALADRSTVAGLYAVSERSVRRHCPVVRYDRDTGAALVDALAAEQDLGGVRQRAGTAAYAALHLGREMPE